MGQGKDIERLFKNNRDWSSKIQLTDPEFFTRSAHEQHPDFFYIGCADSRVVANLILGLQPGDVFTHRNIGNQALHSDPNCMSCMEYAVDELKVKHILVCGHYNCGAIKAALKMPYNCPGIVNNWISSIRDVRDAHHSELAGLNEEDQLARLCELNVMRQVFSVVTSSAVQSAWARGQKISVHGLVYDISTGLIRRLMGPVFMPEHVDSILHHTPNNMTAHFPMGNDAHAGLVQLEARLIHTHGSGHCSGHCMGHEHGDAMAVSDQA